MQIPIPQLVRVGTLEITAVVSDDARVEIWDSFLSLQIKETTQRAYSKSLADFCQKIYSSLSLSDALQNFLLLSQSDALHQVLTYRKILIDLKLSSATINQRLSALKSLVDYARKRGLCSFTLIDVKGLRSQKYRDTKGRTVDEYRSVLAEIDRSTILGKRDYAICRLLWDNALRRGEIVSLDQSNFLPQESRLMILGKGTLELKPVDLNPAVVIAINDYLILKPDTNNPALFVSNNGNRLDGKDIARIVKKYAEPVGIDLSPHRVRHSAITAYLDVSEGNVRAAQSLSRHHNLSTLMIYDDNRHQLQGKASKDLGDLLE
ncbi:tyrosine-type recombinase/integrase [Chamaesiphon sp. VAR_48_metabat_135_sub]|uniref:tyrosine-type recombinase/integrase n=1 Tax=Chamaesiphon sp. VAR_48_metabat_135_sub TaxID=2964699 RepID=UPI00286B917D|nr:tyrosine-type recombinase/integrase [Chamaesiphon sp. VAR_48_metabat_135_sub]